MARPSDYTEEVATAICERIAEGQSLRAICEDPGMPARSSVFKWLGEHQSFADQYARAREVQAELYADQIIEIADTEPDSQRARVRIDARKWKASKLKPKIYGEKVTQEHQGPDGGAIPFTVVSGVPRPDAD